MCDTLCSIGPTGTIFGKNSDRPSAEVQLVETYARRQSGDDLQTQYITIRDTGAAALLGSRPDWLWGLEHGVNEHRVAIGNEKIFTTLNPNREPAALIGMDLVRLGLERGRSADDALDTMTELLEEHGQGGIGDQTTGESYFSSFLIADPRAAWVLETSGRSWVAAPVAGSAAISNRITIGREWTRSSPDIAPGTDFDEFRHPNAPTGHSDVRLAASRACLADAGADLTPSDVAAHLRDHGADRWGSPGKTEPVQPPPEGFGADGTGVTVCMHLRGFQHTTSSMIAELPADEAAPLRAWIAPGSPCVSVYVPVFPPDAVPPALGEPETWKRFAGLRDRVEADPTTLDEVRSVFGPLESELWAEADDIAMSPDRHGRFVKEAWGRVAEALHSVSKATQTG
ncbi:MAG: C69 family dipeptidase [Chloroflexi bacterium]|nr:C69 family dipeptidase [Chloroflexota bacterium]